MPKYTAQDYMISGAIGLFALSCVTVLPFVTTANGRENDAQKDRSAAILKAAPGWSIDAKRSDLSTLKNGECRRVVLVQAVKRSQIEFNLAKEIQEDIYALRRSVDVTGTPQKHDMQLETTVETCRDATGADLKSGTTSLVLRQHFTIYRRGVHHWQRFQEAAAEEMNYDANKVSGFARVNLNVVYGQQVSRPKPVF